MQEIYCAQCGASILADDGEQPAHCPSCGRNPYGQSRAQLLEAAKEMAAATREPPRKTSFATIALALVLAPCVLCAVFSAIGGLVSDRKPSPAPSPAVAEQVTSKTPAIPGVAAVDVHGNLTNKGFKLSKIHGDEMSEWTCQSENADHTLIATAMGHSPTQITYVSATCMNFGTRDTSAIAAPFLGYVASLPYDGSQPRAAREWVEANVSRNTETTIGSVRLELMGTDRARVLRMSPVR